MGGWRGYLADLCHYDYGPEAGYEYISDYEPGGYCPIHLGDRLDNGTYTICQKLGTGSSSTVWLARNTRHGQDPQKYPYRYVALKILRADESTNSRELSILNHLHSQGPMQDPKAVTDNQTRDGSEEQNAASRGHPGIIRLIHTFDIQSANGHHKVLVLPLTRPLRELSHKFGTDGRMWEDMSGHYFNIVRQLLEAMAFIHERGVVHGDLQDFNVGYLCEDITDFDIHSVSECDIKSTWLWRYPDEAPSALSAFSKDFLSNTDPEFTAPLPSDLCERIPKYVVSSELWQTSFFATEFARYQTNPRVVLMDFSGSFMKDAPQANHRLVCGISKYKPAEYILPTLDLDRPADVDAKWIKSTRCYEDYREAFGDLCQKEDVWNCAGIVKGLIGGGSSFNLWDKETVHALLIDPHVTEDWKRRNLGTEAMGKVKEDVEQASRAEWDKSLAGALKKAQGFFKKREGRDTPVTYKVDLDAFPPLYELLKFMLRVDPRVRPSAAEIVKHLPDFLKVNGKQDEEICDG